MNDSTSGINKQWSVTNKTKGTVAAISAVSTKDNPSGMMYEMGLSYLPTDKQGNTLPSGEATNVTLDGQMASGDYQPIYDVIFSDPSNAFPVDDTSAMLPVLGDSYPAYTVPPSATEAMENSYNFFRMIQAYPTSTLAKDFNQALTKEQSNQSQTTPSSSNPIDEFFSGTKTYQNCTSVTYAAILSYSQTFAGASVGFVSNYTFHLYSSSSDKVSEVGTVSFDLNDVKTPFDLTDNNAGYTIVFTDSNGQTTPLFYNQGQFVSDVNSDLPDICLQITWASSNQVNGTSTSPNTIVPIIAGYVNGVKATGTATKQDISSGKSIWGWPSTITGWFGLVMGVGGAIMFGDWIIQKLRGKSKARAETERASNEREITDQQNQALNERIDNLAAETAENNQAILDRLQSGEKFSQDLTAVDNQVTNALNDVNTSAAQAVMEQQIGEYGDQIEALAEYGVTPELSDAASTLREAARDVANANTPEQMKAAREKWDPKLEDVQKSVNERVESLGNEISAETKNNIDASNENLEDLSEMQESLEEQQEAEEQGNADEESDFEGDFD
ncbi:hypothetical protein CWN94_09860 [Vibrio splendidus]|uniref:hypothetical protein n=1 Tax=Vibrio splendidus TaxID=29497 RepID=UPI000D3424BB|nr:hypothetical protein [Vibrio splendidus]PTO54487.1 hypothetical protein CWN94_09860 [Vibrio splendidus]